MIPGVKRVCLGCGVLTSGGSRCDDCAAKRARAVEQRRAPKPPGYHAAHARLRRERGPASAYPCICGCGGMAAEWALRHEGPGRGPALWSENVFDYDPMCKSSHSRRDAPGGKDPGAG